MVSDIQIKAKLEPPVDRKVEINMMDAGTARVHRGECSVSEFRSKVVVFLENNPEYEVIEEGADFILVSS